MDTNPSNPRWHRSDAHRVEHQPSSKDLILITATIWSLKIYGTFRPSSRRASSISTGSTGT
eukprot:8613968-Prorocentrum_lima.AAC.1